MDALHIAIAADSLSDLVQTSSVLIGCLFIAACVCVIALARDRGC